MKRSFCTTLLAGGALALLAGCATAPVGELMSCSAPIADFETGEEHNYSPYPPTYHGLNPSRQYLRGASGSTPLRFNIRRAQPEAVAERVDGRLVPVAAGEERLIATETYGFWQ